MIAAHEIRRAMRREARREARRSRRRERVAFHAPMSLFAPDPAAVEHFRRVMAATRRDLVERARGLQPTVRP